MYILGDGIFIDSIRLIEYASLAKIVLCIQGSTREKG